MAKTTITIRIDNHVKNQLTEYAKKNNNNVSEFLSEMIFRGLKNMKGNKKFKEVVTKYRQDVDRMLKRSNAKSSSRDYYTIINYLKRIVNHARDNFVMTGDYNMIITKKWIKMCNEEYNLLDDDVKKALKKQLDFINTFSDPKVVENFIMSRKTKFIGEGINEKTKK